MTSNKKNYSVYFYTMVNAKQDKKIHETIRIWRSNFIAFDILLHQVILSFIFLHVLIWFTIQQTTKKCLMTYNNQ
jgi:hypothetical protein